MCCASLKSTWHRPQRLACGRAKATHGQPQEGRLRLSALTSLPPDSLDQLPSILLLSAHSSNNTHSRPLPLPPHQSFAITRTTPLDRISDQHSSLNTIRDSAWNTISDPATLPTSTSVAFKPHSDRAIAHQGFRISCSTTTPHMASRQYASMGSRPALKTENFDMDSFFDFNQGGNQPSPINPSQSRPDATPQAANQEWNALSPFDQPEERQQFNGPSHDYNQYKQQVGLPLGSIHNMPMHPQMMDGFNSGIDMNMDSGFGNGWSSGIDMDAEMGMDFNQPQHAAMPPPMFFPADGPSGNFVNPNTLGGQAEASSSAGRLYPGMHSQQAQQIAMQKAAQTQAMQQRQMRLQAQQQQYRQAANAAQSQSQGSSVQQQSHGNGKRPSHAAEPHVEESISRLLNQMRHNSSASGDDAGSPDNLLPQIARMRKDEEEMDEDERLLASEEGKKLSSKERRQLRNKVSARAFRSRRKGMFCYRLSCP
jgi:hypothetical protein